MPSLTRFRNLTIPCFTAEAPIVYLGNERSKQIKTITFYHGEPVIDRRSTFQAHCAKVTSAEQVKNALAYLLKSPQVSKATYNINAYRIQGSHQHTIISAADPGIGNDNYDDKKSAAQQLLRLMESWDVRNVLVVVSHWYGGIKLGADRLKHINSAARDLLEKSGFICVPQSEIIEKPSRKKKSK